MAWTGRFLLFSIGITSFHFVGSKENDLWNSYKKQNRRQVFKLGFYIFLSFYPVAEDEVVQKVIEAVSKERENIMTILKAL
jgi:hypothetical protein